jgi:hypothetical protein
MKRKKTDLNMKKLILFLMILTLGAGINLQAAKPIPSYKEKVSRVANFKEKHLGDFGPDNGIKGKRYMVVVAQVAGPSKTPITIWVYSLDLRDIMGPYTVEGSGEIEVPIDGREWGVLVQCEDKCSVSVWTTDNPGGGGEVGEPINL